MEFDISYHTIGSCDQSGDPFEAQHIRECYARCVVSRKNATRRY